jgi:hypothetical protein
MLSDVCCDTLVEIWESGAPDLGRLRLDILHYTVEPFDYPKSVTNVLLAAVHETGRYQEGDNNALVGPLVLMALLLCTLRGYDSPDVKVEEGLPLELLRWWPQAQEAIARLPPPSAEELPAALD